MGIFKGSATLTRYQVEGGLPAGAADFLDQRIRRNAFSDIEETTDELAVGWVSAGDYLDTSFAYAGYSLGPYVVLGFRVDARKVPAAMLRKYQRLEELKFLAMSQDQEGVRLNRGRREQLRERARLGLLARIPPTTQVYDMVWDTGRAEVWLGSASRGVLERFEDHFSRSFSLGLTPRLPYLLAGDLLPHDRERAQLAEARPLDFYMSGGDNGPA